MAFIYTSLTLIGSMRSSFRFRTWLSPWQKFIQRQFKLMAFPSHLQTTFHCFRDSTPYHSKITILQSQLLKKLEYLWEKCFDLKEELYLARTFRMVSCYQTSLSLCSLSSSYFYYNKIEEYFKFFHLLNIICNWIREIIPLIILKKMFLSKYSKEKTRFNLKQGTEKIPRAMMKVK